MKQHVKYLKSINACSAAVVFAKKYNTMQEVWNACNRLDWLFWLLTKQALGIGSDSRKAITFAAAQCARTALKYTKDPKVLARILTIEGYTRGENTIGQIMLTRDAAVYATADAAADAVDAAAYAAANAAAAAATAADAAVYAAVYAADAAAYAAADAAADAAVYAASSARLACLLECVEIIKTLFPVIKCGKWVANPNYKEKNNEQRNSRSNPRDDQANRSKNELN